MIFAEAALLVLLSILSASCKIDRMYPSPDPVPPSPIPPHEIPERPPLALKNIQDPKFPEQWYLYNDGSTEGSQKGIDINVAPVWEKEYYGQGMKVAIYDSGLDPSHPDLKDNFSPGNLYKLVSDDNTGCTSHGNLVAGIIAARDNTIGIRGIAPRAQIYGFHDGSLKTGIIDSLGKNDVRSVSAWNFSIGPRHEYIYVPLNDELIQAFDNAIENGFGGLGSSLVFAAGNLPISGVAWGGTSSNSPYLNYPGIIGVNAIEKSGEWPSGSLSLGHTQGTNIWITAPTRAISTNNTQCENGYYSPLAATSGAKPMVTGAMVLLRQAYPRLTWRDVKMILAESALKVLPGKTDIDDGTYFESGRMYHNSSKKQYYHRLAGFGLLDLGRAFEIAENWKLMPRIIKEVHPGLETPLDTSSVKKNTNHAWKSKTAK